VRLELVDILGVEFYPVTLQGALETIDWMMNQESGRTRLVITANPVMVMTAQKDPEFMDILKRADLIVPDGVGIIWAARKKGLDLPERVTGVELAYGLLGQEPSPKIFFLGGKEGVGVRAAENAKQMFPGARITGVCHGYFSLDEEHQVVKTIRDSQSDILFCAMGSPKQEKFIWKYRHELGAKVGIGLGGVLDVLAGDKKRAPEYIQKMGLEWLYRLILEPSRIKQDMVLLQFAAKVLATGSKDKTSSGDGGIEDGGLCERERGMHNSKNKGNR